MNDDMIDDLKQFITATVHQATSGLATREGLAALDTKLSAKIDDVQTSVAEALDTSNDETGKQIRDLERRVARLEKRAA